MSQMLVRLTNPLQHTKKIQEWQSEVKEAKALEREEKRQAKARQQAASGKGKGKGRVPAPADSDSDMDMDESVNLISFSTPYEVYPPAPRST